MIEFIFYIFKNPAFGSLLTSFLGFLWWLFIREHISSVIVSVCWSSMMGLIYGEPLAVGISFISWNVIYFTLEIIRKEKPKKK